MASQEEIKFLSNPSIGHLRKNTVDFESLVSNISTTEILNSCYNLLMIKANFFQEGSLATHSNISAG